MKPSVNPECVWHSQCTTYTAYSSDATLLDQPSLPKRFKEWSELSGIEQLSWKGPSQIAQLPHLFRSNWTLKHLRSESISLKAQKHDQQFEGGDAAPLLCSHWHTIWSTASSSGALNTRTWSCSGRSRGGPQRWSEGWNTSPVRKGWESWSSSAPVEKRRLQGDLGVAFQYLKGPTGKLGRDFLSGQVATGQGEMALNWKREDLDYTSGRNFLLWGWGDTGTGCPARLWMPPPSKHSKPGWIGLLSNLI